MNLLKYRIKTFFKYQDLVRELVQRDLKLKYRRSFLGYLWSVLNPLLIMIVLTVVFSNLFNKSIKNFPVYLVHRTYALRLSEGEHDECDEIRDRKCGALEKGVYSEIYFYVCKGDELYG